MIGFLSPRILPGPNEREVGRGGTDPRRAQSTPLICDLSPFSSFLANSLLPFAFDILKLWSLLGHRRAAIFCWVSWKMAAYFKLIRPPWHIKTSLQADVDANQDIVTVHYSRSVPWIQLFLVCCILYLYPVTCVRLLHHVLEKIVFVYFIFWPN